MSTTYYGQDRIELFIKRLHSWLNTINPLNHIVFNNYSNITILVKGDCIEPIHKVFHKFMVYKSKDGGYTKYHIPVDFLIEVVDILDDKGLL